MGSIITLRIIMIISAQIVSAIGGYYTLWPCEKLDFILGGHNITLVRYPTCALQPERPAVVLANFSSASREEIGAALGVNFGMAAWIATSLHAVCVEIYVSEGYVISI
jgi:hypothetical protein